MRVSRVGRSLLSRIKDEVEMAISEPDESAIDTEALVRAGVSLVPSPTKATIRGLPDDLLFGCFDAD